MRGAEGNTSHQLKLNRVKGDRHRLGKSDSSDKNKIAPVTDYPKPLYRAKFWVKGVSEKTIFQESGGRNPQNG